MNNSRAKRLTLSPFLWILVSLIILDTLLNFFNPLLLIKNTEYMPQSKSPIVSKIPEFLSSRNNPDILIMGSSLPMLSIAMWDAEYTKTLDASDLDAVRRYTGAVYLEKLLNKRSTSGKKLKVFNLTSAGNMASDAPLLLEKSLQSGKHPRAIIYGIAPRTFLDNSFPNDTAIAEVLRKWRTIRDLLDENFSFEEKRDIFISQFWTFYRDRSDYQSFLLCYTSCKLDRAPTLYAARQREEARKALKQSRTAPNSGSGNTPPSLNLKCSTEGHPAPDRLMADLAVYNVRYNPPNLKQFEKEIGHLQEFIKLCHHQQIKLFIVNMPITEQNRALLKGDLYARYLRGVSSLAAQTPGTVFLDLNDGKTCKNNDFFLDSVHCNAVGGKKVQDRLANSMAGENWM